MRRLSPPAPAPARPAPAPPTVVAPAPAMAPAQPVDPEKAKAEKEATVKRIVEFQRKRAEAGSATAQYDLAMRYLKGDGVEKDLALAKKWLQAAAKNGHTLAPKKLEALKQQEQLKPPEQPKPQEQPKPAAKQDVRGVLRSADQPPWMSRLFVAGRTVMAEGKPPASWPCLLAGGRTTNTAHRI